MLSLPLSFFSFTKKEGKHEMSRDSSCVLPTIESFLLSGQDLMPALYVCGISHKHTLALPWPGESFYWQLQLQFLSNRRSRALQKNLRSSSCLDRRLMERNLSLRTRCLIFLYYKCWQKISAEALANTIKKNVRLDRRDDRWLKEKKIQISCASIRSLRAHKRNFKFFFFF